MTGTISEGGLIVAVTVLPDYEVLVQVAHQAMEAVPAVSPTASEAERRRYYERRRSAGSKALDVYKPVIDELADMTQAAAFLGYVDAGTVRRKLWRHRKDGTPEWPAHDMKIARSPAWRYRTIVVHLAMSPGRGSPGIQRGPRQKKPAG
jgi:hypothetical protein